MRHVGAHPFLARLASDGAHGRLPVIGLGLAGSASSLMRPGPGIRPEETDHEAFARELDRTEA